MSSKLQDNLLAIKAEKELIRAAIDAKNPEVPTTSELSSFAPAIESISTGEKPPEPTPWTRPEGWPDLEQIVKDNFEVWLAPGDDGSDWTEVEEASESLDV